LKDGYELDTCVEEEGDEDGVSSVWKKYVLQEVRENFM
jgi:hypothetical protein